ncbi:MAG: PDZ domain-containing protein [Dongiaceae bacterium]
MNQASFAQLARTLIVAATLLAFGRPAEAKYTIEFCNVGNTTVSLVTIGDHPGGGWAVDGWQTILPGACHKIDAIFKMMAGFAITTADGHRGMQVYDPGTSPQIVSTQSSYCLPAKGNFHRWHEIFVVLSECEVGDVLARFAFNLKPMRNNRLTIRIPADENGAIIPFEVPTSAANPFPAIQPYDRLSPEASFEIALRGLAEQQERLHFRIERQEPSLLAYWRVFYLRDLGIVVRPETHAALVAKGSPADKTGLRVGDEVVRIDEIAIQSAWHARGLLQRTRPGEIHKFTFLRDAQLREQVIELDALPTNLALTELHPKRGWIGVEFESSAQVAGVIYQDGAPHLELGDRILKIERSDFDGVDGLARELARGVDANTVELQVRRAATHKIIVMTLNKLK